ncbi:hypothetical protein N7468_003149 [Penicillium chermesinum]|uniref:Apple domain-containing protein n=1 Tax=Penicillium chermesinum TaxID=63820 RepID=A0A9W9P6H4_9EURO|nr:uncharacterized protein N7468_003149 [Penicillium chermesinum]KAJ5238530.1 hypothetical protein N7468_003149 [Penicillium chermesinum]KAJ6164186.1 hypothetical protein N7470_002858 [Penicillium chermesinum]
MIVAPFWVSIAFLAPRALAEAVSATSTTSTAATPSCTASLIDSLCSYPEPNGNFAVAEDSVASCWDYCNNNPPCDFIIFNAGNPTLGTGTCWLYPGETFDASKGTKCSTPNLSVYNKPVCSGGSATTTSGACAATATPSAIASVCGYPMPGDCFENCYASSGATNCLSICAEADSCSYAVFNPHNDGNSQYADGTCWVYPNGTYNAKDSTTCKGGPEQYVYKNVCPKPSSKAKSTSSSSSVLSSSTGTAEASSSSTTGAAPGSTTSSKNTAPTGLSLTNPLPPRCGNFDVAGLIMISL